MIWGEWVARIARKSDKSAHILKILQHLSLPCNVQRQFRLIDQNQRVWLCFKQKLEKQHDFMLLA